MICHLSQTARFTERHYAERHFAEMTTCHSVISVSVGAFKYQPNYPLYRASLRKVSFRQNDDASFRRNDDASFRHFRFCRCILVSAKLPALPSVIMQSVIPSFLFPSVHFSISQTTCFTERHYTVSFRQNDDASFQHHSAEMTTRHSVISVSAGTF
jgi:hypothetical protein